MLRWPPPDKITFTNGVNKSEFPPFSNETCKVPKKLVNQQDTGKVSNFELFCLFLANFSRLTAVKPVKVLVSYPDLLKSGEWDLGMRA